MWRYIEAMFEVLAFVYENYWAGDSCPELPVLQRRLNAVGFDSREVVDALLWLEGLKSAARGLHRSHHGRSALTTVATLPPAGHLAMPPAGQRATRIFTAAEQDRLGGAGWGFVIFLAAIGALPDDRLELVMERAMAASGDPIGMEDIKLIVLMVYWSLGEEPDALLLDELCDNRVGRLAN